MAIAINHIPHTPGVYLFKNWRGTILYIGKAKDLKKRVNQYFAPWSVRKQDMINKAKHIDFIEVTNESEALYLEDNLIKKHKPEYNRLLKADNSYAYIKITNEEFPQVYISRDRKNDKATYIGPKHNTKVLRKLLQYLRQVYKFRTEPKGKFNKGEVSSDFYFWLDAWRSIYAKLNDKNAAKYIAKGKAAWLAMDKSYQEYKTEYKKIMKQLISFFNGNIRSITKDIEKKLQECIANQHFEYAATLRDIYLHLEQLTERQHVVLNPSLTGKIVRLTTINQHHVLIMVHIFEWKMIDIVREKYLVNDRSYNQIISACENDFGTMDIFEYHNEQFWKIEKNYLLEKKHHHTFLLVSQTMKRIKKDERSAIYELMEKFIDSYLASDSFREHSLLNELLQNLEKKYKLTQFPYRIECVDISHLSGGRISWWLATFIGWIPFKKWYRRYKIESVKESTGYNNDYQALKEIIIRRFLTWSKTASSELPELFIIDGGKGQLWIIKQLIKKYPELKGIMPKVQFVSLGKGEARHSKGKTAGAQEVLYSLDKHNNIMEKKLDYDQTDKILIKVRDEAHRFANNYRKKRMSMEWRE